MNLLLTIYSTDDVETLTPATLQKRRGVVHSFISRLTTRLKDLESKVEQPTTLDHAQQMSKRLETTDSESKVHYYALVNHIDCNKVLGKEQETLDEHDDDMATLAACIYQTTNNCLLLFTSIYNGISPLSTDPEKVCLLYHMRSNSRTSRTGQL